jgi:hypothetical protein
MSSRIDPVSGRDFWWALGAGVLCVTSGYVVGQRGLPTTFTEWGWLFVYTLTVGSGVNFTYRIGKAHGRDEAERLRVHNSTE